MQLFSSGLLNTNTLLVPVVDQYVFIVDPAGCSLSSDDEVIINELTHKNLIPLFVLLTHGHFDHILGLTKICEVYNNIPIFLHENDKPFLGLSSPQYQKSCLSSLGLEEIYSLLPKLEYPTTSITVNLGLGDFYHSLHIAESDNETIITALNKWFILHTPGHTQGSICLHNASEKQIISGDTLLYNSVGRTDLIDGDVNVQAETIKKLQNQIPANTTVIPGHGYVYHFGDSTF
ncbi:MAG: MBL fold metallo-hydrolase [Treponema sp.]|nr:MBL fold metallo-hydrolase [Treponema sp.]